MLYDVCGLKETIKEREKERRKEKGVIKEKINVIRLQPDVNVSLLERFLCKVYLLFYLLDLKMFAMEKI